MGCTWLVITGGVLEGFGFLLIVVKLALVQYREFGWPRSVLRLRAAWRRLLRKPPITHRLGASFASSFDIAARLQVRKGMGPDVADRLGAVEHNLKALDEDFNQRNKELDENWRGSARTSTPFAASSHRRRRSATASGRASFRLRCSGRRGARSCSSSASA